MPRLVLLALILAAPLAAAPCEVRAAGPKCADCGDGCQCGPACGCDAARLERILSLPGVMVERDGTTARGPVGALLIRGGELDGDFVRRNRLTPADIKAAREWAADQRSRVARLPAPPPARHYYPPAPDCQT
jgi:hypothetical protein